MRLTCQHEVLLFIARNRERSFFIDLDQNSHHQQIPDKPGKLTQCIPIYVTILGQCTRNRANVGPIFLVCRDNIKHTANSILVKYWYCSQYYKCKIRLTPLHTFHRTKVTANYWIYGICYFWKLGASSWCFELTCKL